MSETLKPDSSYLYQIGNVVRIFLARFGQPLNELAIVFFVLGDILSLNQSFIRNSSLSSKKINRKFLVPFSIRLVSSHFELVPGYQCETFSQCDFHTGFN